MEVAAEEHRLDIKQRGNPCVAGELHDWKGWGLEVHKASAYDQKVVWPFRQQEEELLSKMAAGEGMTSTQAIPESYKERGKQNPLDL